MTARPPTRTRERWQAGREACELRQNSPFAGVLPDGLRARVLHSFNRHWPRDHAAA